MYSYRVCADGRKLQAFALAGGAPAGGESDFTSKRFHAVGAQGAPVLGGPCEISLWSMGPNTFTWLGTRYDLPFNSHCNVASTFAMDCWHGPGAANPGPDTCPVRLVTEVAATPTWRTVTNTQCEGRATGIGALNDAIKSGTTVAEAQAACAASLACTGFQFHTTWGGGTTPQYFTDADETESTCYDNQQGWTAYFMVY
eukprot:g6105.t1